MQARFNYMVILIYLFYCMAKSIVLILCIHIYFSLTAQNSPLKFEENSYNFGDVTIAKTYQYAFRFQNTSNKLIKGITIVDTTKYRLVDLESYIEHPIYPGNFGEITLAFTPNEVGSFKKDISLAYQFQENIIPFVLQIQGNVKQAKSGEKISQTRGLNKANSKTPEPINLDSVQSYIAYPSIARQNEIQGQVIMDILIDEEGKYIKHLVKSSAHNLLTESVEQHIEQLRFMPAMINKQQIASWTEISIDFRLHNKDNLYQMKIFCK